MTKIKINQEECIGCGSCQAVCPDVFDLGHDNKACLKNGKDQGEADEKCIEDAIDICPVDAIKTEE